MYNLFDTFDYANFRINNSIVSDNQNNVIFVLEVYPDGRAKVKHTKPASLHAEH